MDDTISTTNQRRTANFATAFTIIMIIVGLYSYYSSRVTGERKYTIATVYNQHGGLAGLYFSQYSYVVENVKYYGQIKSGTVKIGGRYIVAFSVKSPEKSELCALYRVRTAIEAPESGWSKKPSKEELK